MQKWFHQAAKVGVLPGLPNPLLIQCMLLEQVLMEQLEYEGAPIHLEPKLDFVTRKKAERKSKAEVIPNSHDRDMP